jgi:hypothetical protein
MFENTPTLVLIVGDEGDAFNVFQDGGGHVQFRSSHVGSPEAAGWLVLVIPSVHSFRMNGFNIAVAQLANAGSQQHGHGGLRRRLPRCQYRSLLPRLPAALENGNHERDCFRPA